MSPLVGQDRPIMVPVVAGEEMAAVVPGHKIEMFDGSGVQGGIDRVSARICNGARRQAGVLVSVIGRIKFEITLMNDPIELFDPLELRRSRWDRTRVSCCVSGGCGKQLRSGGAPLPELPLSQLRKPGKESVLETGRVLSTVSVAAESRECRKAFVKVLRISSSSASKVK